MSKSTKDDTGGVKTLKLARGAAGGSGHSRPLAQRTPSGSGNSHFGLLSKESSPITADKSNSLNTLTQNGIVELLEQDDRPTFILDLAEQTASEPGPLKIAFANAALTAVAGLLDTILGLVRQESPSPALGTPFSDFKSWCTSYVQGHEPRDVVLPSCSYAGTVWMSSNLQKRFRVFRSNPVLPTSNPTSDPRSLGLLSISPASKENDDPSTLKSVEARMIEESPQDYFGPAGNVHLTQPGDTIESAGATGNAHGLRIAKLTDPLDLPAPGVLPVKTPLADDKAQEASVPGHQYTAFPNQDQGFFDWTRLANSATLPRHIQFAKSVDWASTSLGPIEGWSSELRCMCNLIMASPHPAAMYWGPDYVAIYNEAYIYLAGQKHPQLMGQRYREAWAEIWDSVKDVFHQAGTTGVSTMKEDDCLFIQRTMAVDSLEEAWFDWSIIPLVGGDGSVVGLYNPVVEKTKRKVGERRMETLSSISERTSTAKDLKTFWRQIISGLEANVYDAPFALLYSVNNNVDRDSQTALATEDLQAAKSCMLEGSIGVPPGHPAAIPQVDLRNENSYLGRVFHEADRGDRPLLLSVEKGTLDPGLLEGMVTRGHPEPCSAAVCCPVKSTNDETLGYLLIGINPRRPFDEDYNTFIQLLSRQISTAVASVLFFEEEIRANMKAKRRADITRIELAEQLAVQTQVVMDTERRFTQMAKFAPVGIFMARSDGVITYRNDKWYEIMRSPDIKPSKDPEAAYQWIEAIKDEDKERVEQLWLDLLRNGTPMCTEVRFKSSWVDQNDNEADTWVLASGYPDKDEDGNVRNIYGSITDISQQKWAEMNEKKRLEEAVETKRQHENFIDIVCHELRNPLAAMLLCSEEIINLLLELIKSMLREQLVTQTPHGTVHDLIQAAIESSKTISQCAQHQKRIVDDILTVSKLDSALLLVTPCPEKPEVVVRRALKMFEMEAKTADIKMDFHIDESFRKLAIEWVQLDRSRLAQVLINLVTNAIKFTATQGTRRIIITLSATLERPPRDGAIAYFPPRVQKPDLTDHPDWGNGEQVYIHVAVVDTGRGLDSDEKKLLFMRFSQASPRTHVKYGGSGLGLFISRELVELQGGEIGVASESGKGSTFAFYIKTRRTTEPEHDSDYLLSVEARKPFDKSASLPLRSAQQDLEEAQSKSKKPTIVPSDPATAANVLLVEDNIINQNVLARALKKFGNNVHVANHGGECLDRLKGSTFWKDNRGRSSKDGQKLLEIDVILMDQEMPIMDGLTCTKIIREMELKGELAGHVPIIAVTANARAEQIGAAKAVGMDDVVSKPFRVDDLMPIVRGLKAEYPAPALA